MTPLERFWLKVEDAGPDDCWNWRTASDDYGRFNVVRGGRLTLAHRFSWILHNRQDIPDGLMVLHSCDNKRCVNPAHLSLGTAADNARQASDRGLLAHLPRARAARRRNITHCARRHELTEDNIYLSGGRVRCRECHRMREAKYRAQRKLAAA